MSLVANKIQKQVFKKFGDLVSGDSITKYIFCDDILYPTKNELIDKIASSCEEIVVKHNTVSLSQSIIVSSDYEDVYTMPSDKSVYIDSVEMPYGTKLVAYFTGHPSKEQLDNFVEFVMNNVTI